MTSMINVGELAGSLSAAPLNDYFGRKGVFMVGTVTIIAGVILQLVTTSSRDLMTAGRAILGFGVGNFSATSPLYMAVRRTPRSSLAPHMNISVRTTLMRAPTGNLSRVPPRPDPNVLATHPLHFANHRRGHKPRRSRRQDHIRLPFPHRLPTPLSRHGAVRHLVRTRVAPLAHTKGPHREGRGSAEVYTPRRQGV